MSDLSKASQAIQDFANCKHKWWRCESCGCKTTSEGVEGLCDGLRTKLLELLIEVQQAGVSYRGKKYNEVQIYHSWYDAVEEVLKGVDQ